jgi:uncharacterized protein
MSDEVWKRDKIESPCVKICVMDSGSGFCLGCYRTLEEIADWAAMTSEARRSVMAALDERRMRLKRGRKGGRSGRLVE